MAGNRQQATGNRQQGEKAFTVRVSELIAVARAVAISTLRFPRKKGRRGN
jgi:hypothetical protein